ncbi:hypothetical protein EX30DRAFT_233396 [Ascodesmis nigricans]|uniref:Uncharacterized protein n=1 Tax=Ascodesmis nigricans TaxID=341454 RepID=A0A4S2MYW6_9PEZI|nr:hypothetical protein EX30DRAFT_233396 [Ascodesmis nigricans]
MSSINILLAVAKHENEHYIDTLSPPSSANDSDSLPPIASIHAQSHQAFQPRYPATAHYGGVMYEREEDDEDLEAEHEDDDMMRQHTETETEDEDYNSYGLHGMQYNPYMPHMQQRPRQSRPKSQKRKRQSTFDSTSSSSSFSSGSRWHELVEAATTRAVVESTPLLLSPPQTANTLPTNCPNTPSGSITSSTHDGCSPKIQCAECNSCAPLHQSYICTECVAGFCEECALTAGKRGVCSECRVFNAKFKPLKIVIRA